MYNQYKDVVSKLWQNFYIGVNCALKAWCLYLLDCLDYNIGFVTIPYFIYDQTNSFNLCWPHHACYRLSYIYLMWYFPLHCGTVHNCKCFVRWPSISLLMIQIHVGFMILSSIHWSKCIFIPSVFCPPESSRPPFLHCCATKPGRCDTTDPLLANGVHMWMLAWLNPSLSPWLVYTCSAVLSVRQKPKRWVSGSLGVNHDRSGVQQM